MMRTVCLTLVLCSTVLAGRGGKRQIRTTRPPVIDDSDESDFLFEKNNYRERESSSLSEEESNNVQLKIQPNVFANQPQDPSDPSASQALQLAIQNVQYTFNPQPSFYYYPVDRIKEVQSGAGETFVTYHIRYLTPNGWFLYGYDCQIDFILTEDPVNPTNPTWRDIQVSSLICVKRTS